MKRCILTAPETLKLEDLSDTQQSAISDIFSQWLMPMPVTVAFAGSMIIDAVLNDNFNSDKIDELGLPFAILGLWKLVGYDLVEIVPLHTSFFDYLPDGSPHVIPHNWAGWPYIN